MTELERSKEIIEYISNSTRKTPVKMYTDAEIKGEYSCQIFGDSLKLVIGDLDEVEKLIKENNIEKYHLEVDRRNSAIPLLDIKKINARIEPGAIIRDRVSIGDKAVIMMGSVINIGAKIGEGTMIDMNVVLGGRATVGKNCHIGAGTVLAGVIEPPSADPVSVVAAGAVVTENVPSGVMVAGMPAKIIKNIDDKTKSKTELVEGLRK